MSQLDPPNESSYQALIHDLRNPLNLIMGALSLLEDSLSAPTSEQARCLTLIRTSGGQMNALIDQLLALESQRTGLTDFSLADLVRELTNNAEVLVQAQHQTLTYAAPATSQLIRGERAWMRRVVDNLLSNAIKYTPRGGHIQVTYHEADHEAVCEVNDTGPGIPHDMQVRLFERFYRVPNNTNKLIAGTGLGLAIVKEIVEQHHGRVWVHSEPGQGATFGFAVPLIAPEMGDGMTG